MYYWLSSKYCHSLNEVIALVLLVPLSQQSWCVGVRSVRKCVTSSGTVDVSGILKKERKKKGLCSRNDSKENEQELINWERKLQTETQRHNFLIRGKHVSRTRVWRHLFGFAFCLGSAGFSPLSICLLCDSLCSHSQNYNTPNSQRSCVASVNYVTLVWPMV